MTNTATTSEQSPNSTKCRLLELPAELRLTVYEELFRATPLDFTKINKTTRTLPSPALLATCRTIRAEAGKVHFDRMYEELANLKNQVDTAINEHRMMRQKRHNSNAPSLLTALRAQTTCLGALVKIQDLRELHTRSKVLVDQALQKWRADGIEYRKKGRA